jgi:hypothetical protein
LSDAAWWKGLRERFALPWPARPFPALRTLPETDEAVVDGVQGIVVELFSSEGCSSCPPADSLLRTLDAQQPVPRAHVIALEFHVDYWNRLGWSDPFSDAKYSERQRAYGIALDRRRVCTPQMIVNGGAEFVGSNAAAATAAIAAAAEMQHVGIALRRRAADVTVSIPAQLNALEIWSAETERGLQTAVPRGENSGRTLTHGPIVRALDFTAVTVPGRSYMGRLAAPDFSKRALVVFVSDRTTHRVYGAAELR